MLVMFAMYVERTHTLAGLVIFVIPVVFTAVVGLMFFGNAQTNRQMRYLRYLVDRCTRKHGLGYTQNIINECNQKRWRGVENIISTLEEHCDLHVDTKRRQYYRTKKRIRRR